MKARTDYRPCPYCGCNLDAGEICDCRNEKRMIEDNRIRAKYYAMRAGLETDAGKQADYLYRAATALQEGNK